jgi:hypothetical protein
VEKEAFVCPLFSILVLVLELLSSLYCSCVKAAAFPTTPGWERDRLQVQLGLQHRPRLQLGLQPRLRLLLGLLLRVRLRGEP